MLESLSLASGSFGCFRGVNIAGRRTGDGLGVFRKLSSGFEPLSELVIKAGNVVGTAVTPVDDQQATIVTLACRR